MVKKTYINPEIIVVRLMPTTVLAASDPNVTVNTAGDVDADKVETKSVSNVNVWDEEW